MKLRQGMEIVTVVVAAAGCAPAERHTARHDDPWYESVTVPTRTDSDRIVPTQSDADRVARYYDRILILNAKELAGELDLARHSFEKDKSELNRLQLALLLSLPSAAFRDDNTAIVLLNPFAKDKGREGSTLRPLALWLLSELIELRRAEETMQVQAAKLKEEQRRSEALQQKLEAILDMEMKMIEREQNLPKKK